MDFAVPAEYKMKIKENIEKHRDLVRELKNSWNIRMGVMTIIVGAFGTVPNGFEKRLEKLMTRRKIETTSLLK